MAGTSYTRQSTIQNNETIEASLFNNEFNKLVNSFQYVSTSGGTTGHRHDGTAAEGGNIYKVGDEDFLNKIVVDGQLNGADGNNRIGFFVQVSSAAVEQIRIQDGVVVPVTDSDIDLGTSSVKYKHIYTDNITADAITGTLATAAQTNVTSLGTLTGLTISSSNTTADLVISNTADSADASPIIKLTRGAGSSGHADGEDIGKIEFYGNNDRGLSSGGPEETLFGSITVDVTDSSDGTEDGSIVFTAITGGTANTTVLTLNGTESTFANPVKVAVGPLTINSNTTSADLVITNNENGADASPIIELHRSQSAGADGEDLGKIEFHGSNDRGFSSGGPEKILYGSLSVEISDASDGTEDGALKYSKVVGGSQQTGDLVTQPNNGGVQFPAQSAAPSSPANGQVYYDTDDHKLKVYANGAWANLN